MKPKNLVILISGNGSNLQAIIDAIAAGKINAKITRVISNKADAFGLERAKNHNIATSIVDHKAFANREDGDKELLSVIESAQADFLILAGYMRILSTFFVDHFCAKMVNIHPSLLPKYKGLHTHQRALDNNDKEHGVSVHFVTPELDGGPVILQSRVPVFSDDNATLLAQRVQTQEQQLYPLVIKWLCEDRLVMRDNHAYLDGALLSPKGYAND